MTMRFVRLLVLSASFATCLIGCGTKDDPADPTSCTPDCSGKACGDDGCGKSCGTCPDDKSCDAVGQCVSSSTEKYCSLECTDDSACTTVSPTARCRVYTPPATIKRCVPTCSTVADCATAEGYTSDCVDGLCTLDCIDDATCSSLPPFKPAKCRASTQANNKACWNTCTEASECSISPGNSQNYKAVCDDGVCSEECIDDTACASLGSMHRCRAAPVLVRSQCSDPATTCTSVSDCPTYENHTAKCE